MKRRSHRPGFLLLEVLLGIVVFALFLTAVSMVVLQGQESTAMAGDRFRGLQATLRSLEAARSVRDGSFASLTAGVHGVTLGPSGTWTLTGSLTTVSGSYATSLTVSSLGTGWSQLLAITGWKHGRFQSGTIAMRTELTDWRAPRSTGDWSAAVLEGSYVDGGTPLFTGMTIAGNTAFVTGDTASGGAGLYMFDISDTASPSRIGSLFSLGTSAYGAGVKGNALYLVTGDSAQEIRVYDVSSPSSPSLTTSYNLSGSSLATSMALAGKYLYVGASRDVTLDEFYSFDVSNTGAIVPLDSLGTAETVYAVGLTGTAALLALNDTATEMTVIDVESPSALVAAAGGDYTLTTSQVGRSIATTGTSAILGLQRSAVSQEMVLINLPLNGGAPPPAAGLWYHEGSGSLLGVAMDPLTCYGFLAADSSKKAFQVVDLRDRTTLPELWTYNSASGPARAIHYDPVRDRVFVLTRTGFLIFRPTAATGPCS